MKEATTKERILKKIRQGLIYKTPNKFADIDLDSNVYTQSTDDLAIQFAEAFTGMSGEFVYCENMDEFRETLKALLDNYTGVFCVENDLQVLLQKADITYQTDDKRLKEIEVGITSCEALAARTGSIFISSKTASGRRYSIFPPIHIVIAYTHQIYPDLKDALQFLKNNYEGNLPSMISITTGPSRTSDIEKTLVLGAHGPKQLYLFLIEG